MSSRTLSHPGVAGPALILPGQASDGVLTYLLLCFQVSDCVPTLANNEHLIVNIMNCFCLGPSIRSSVKVSSKLGLQPLKGRPSAASHLCLWYNLVFWETL